MDLRSGIVSTAQSLGMDPNWLAGIISYETAGTFDPAKAGPTTQWGQHRGLIQFGEPQAQQYGVDWNNPIGSQLGPDGAVAKYFRDRGWQPGMSLEQAYSIVNAGAPNRLNASDANNGGAPGTVAEKVRNQFAPHMAKGAALLGGQGNDTLQARASTQGAPMGLLDSFQQQEEPQRFGDKLRASASDGSLWDGLALAANSLRRRPDDGLAQMISQRQESREGAKRLNRTVEWMRGNGFGDLAGAVESGALSPQQAIAMVMQQPEDNRTDDMREWEVAQSGGYGGTFADWMGKTGGAEMSAKEKEIERIMRTWGVDEKTAVGVVDGIVVVSPNPLTGKPELVNKLTGDTMSGQTAQQPTQAPGGEISVESLPRVDGARDAFGVEGIARDAVNAVAGAAGLPAPFGTTQDAINYFDSFGESILRDIAQAYPRMPAESRMKKLEGLVPKAGGFQGWDNARSKLGTLRNEFETDMGIAKQSLGQSLSPQVRQEIELKIIGLQAAIAKVDQALGALGGAGATSGGNAGTTSSGLKWSVK